MPSVLTDIFMFLVLLSLMDNNDSEELYQAIKNGDHDAFKTFYNAYFEKLFLYLSNRGVQPDIAEELIQNAFIYIWENRDNIKPELSLKAYLYRIAYTRMINHFKKTKNAPDPPHEITGTSSSPYEELKYLDLKNSLKKAIQLLPERRKAVFELCFLNECTYKETSKILNISPKTVENHMILALRDIRGHLKKFKKN